MFGKRGSQSGNINPPAPAPQPVVPESPAPSSAAVPPPQTKPAPVATLLHDTGEPSPPKPVAIDPPRPRVAATEPASIRRSENFYDIKSTVFSALIDTIDLSQLARLDNESAREEIRDIVNDIIALKNIVMSIAEQEDLLEDICNDVLGLGPLEPLLARDEISDIMVNGATKTYIEVGGKVQQTAVRFRDNTQLMNICQRIVSQVGRRVDESSPICDARLPDGSRVNVIVPPLALDGPMISIRKFMKRAITLAKMVEQGNLSQAMATVLSIATKARLNILVSGGTGSGKTTLLNALSQMIDPSERIITIEDAAELQLQQPRVGRLETRVANLEGKGAITIRDLFRNALRMRPDRIIVGEIRGAESMDMLQAMNSGHDGSLGTIHASGPREALTRIENLLEMSGVSLPTRAARAQIATAIDMIVQVSRMADGKRRITSIMEVLGMEGDVITTQELFTYQFERLTADGHLRGNFVPGKLSPHFLPKADYVGLGRELVRALNLESSEMR
jgi:pilus assembly protein CpaF